MVYILFINFFNSVFIQGASEESISSQAQIYGLISVAEKERRERNISLEEQSHILFLIKENKKIVKSLI